MISKGMLDEARAVAAGNVARLAGAARQGRPIVGLEPSCLLTLRDEYPELVRTEDARIVARQSLLLEEFLQREWAKGERPRFAAKGRAALLHGHCHQKALVGTAPDRGRPQGGGLPGHRGRRRLLRHGGIVRLRGRALRPVRQDRRASSGAGRSGGGADVAVCAPGISCRQQVEHTTGRVPKHPAELLWEALAR